MSCPANPSNRTLSDDPKFPISYAANTAFNPRDYPTLPSSPHVPRDSTVSGVFGLELSPGVHAASIVRPAECIAVVEAAHTPGSLFVVDVSHDPGLFDDNGRVIDCFSDCLFTGHSGLTNYLFADGHINALKPTATYRGEQANFWYRDATPLSAEARTTLANAESRKD